MPATPTPRNGARTYARAALWIAILGYSVLHMASALRYAWLVSYGGDILSAFPGPLALRVGQIWPSLSRPWVFDNLGMGPVEWNYGPVLHILTAPFAVLPSQQAAMRAMLVCDAVLVTIALVLWIRMLLPALRTDAVLAVTCVWLNFFPLIEVVSGREIEALELFLVTIAVWELRRARETTAGLAIGTAAMAKFLPAIFIPYMFVKGYRRAAYVAFGVAIAIAALAEPLLGWNKSATMAIAGGEVNGTDRNDFRTSYANQAITNVLYKTFSATNLGNPRPPTIYPRVLRRTGQLIELGVLAATAVFLLRSRGSRSLELEFALLAIVMVLVAPHANTYYMVFVLPALSAGAAAFWWEPSPMTTRLKIVFTAALVCVGFLVPMRVIEMVVHVDSLYIARALQMWSLPAYGAVLAAALVIALHRSGRSAPGEAAMSTPAAVRTT